MDRELLGPHAQDVHKKVITSRFDGLRRCSESVPSPRELSFFGAILGITLPCEAREFSSSAHCCKARSYMIPGVFPTTTQSRGWNHGQTGCPAVGNLRNLQSGKIKGVY